MSKKAIALTGNPEKCTLTLSIKDGDSTLASIDLDTKNAAKIAAYILNAARDTFRNSGRPPPATAETKSAILSVVVPSGYTVGVVRSSKSSPIFYFGDTILAIELGTDTARDIGQTLLAASADEGKTQ